jgi:hypothetical protein
MSGPVAVLVAELLVLDDMDVVVVAVVMLDVDFELLDVDETLPPS